jgi:hypothetical protein
MRIRLPGAASMSPVSTWSRSSRHRAGSSVRTTPVAKNGWWAKDPAGCARAPDVGRTLADVRRATDDWQMPQRVLRVAVQEVRDVLRAATPTHRRLRDLLVALVVVTVGVDLLFTIAAFLLERHAHQTEINTFGSAAFWTTTQLLTVSSQIKNPISAGGRVLDVFMEIYAITVIATLAGAFGSFLQKRGQEIDDKR